MKKIFYLTIPVFLFFVSCKRDFLERDLGITESKEDVFSDPILASRFADRSYNFTINDYGRLGSEGQPFRGTIGEFTDEAVCGNIDEPFKAMYSGNWTQPVHGTEFTALTNNTKGLPPYVKCYQGIRNANVVLEQINNVPWADEPTLNGDLVKAQQLYLRAYFYFELAKRWGGMPLFDKPLYLDETGKNPELDRPRSSFDETVAFIEKDLNDAEQIFATTDFNYVNGNNTVVVYTKERGWNPGYGVTTLGDGDVSSTNNGRADLGAVRALRSRVTLLAASPLWNSSSDATKWQKAADAAKKVIDMNRYELENDYSTILTRPISKEYILAFIRGPRTGNNGFHVQYVISPNLNGKSPNNSGALNPTQNHVDLYEMKTGLRIGDTGSGYTLTNPYLNRDPRLDANVLYNQHPWQGNKMEIWLQENSGAATTYGKDLFPEVSLGTKTGYYCRKMWPESITGASSSNGILNYVFYRYGEILLNYAEALNEAQGPVPDAITVVNQVRARVGMPTVAATFAARGTTLNKDTFRELIRNERAVELAFEDVRWWDILRWKKGPEIVAQTIKRMEVKKIGTNIFEYTPKDMSAGYQRVFEPFQHLYPIPLNEIAKGNNLEQNEGWPTK